jgi:hypothetical protein
LRDHIALSVHELNRKLVLEVPVRGSDAGDVKGARDSGVRSGRRELR